MTPGQKTAVLIELAEKARGWTSLVYCGRVICSDGAGMIRSISEPNTLFLFRGWDPFTSREQAHDLLDAWCERHPEDWYRHERYVGGAHCVVLYPEASAIAATFSEAATLAVCRAARIKVPE